MGRLQGVCSDCRGSIVEQTSPMLEDFDHSSAISDGLV